jgi:hypothetical protein
MADNKYHYYLFNYGLENGSGSCVVKLNQKNIRISDLRKEENRFCIRNNVNQAVVISFSYMGFMSENELYEKDDEIIKDDKTV